MPKDQELFKMNAHGDIWQEPTLFDQGGPANITLPAHTFGFERDDIASGEVWPTLGRHDCPNCDDGSCMICQVDW